MAIPLPERNKQIAGKISATSNPQSIVLYTPSTVEVLGTKVNYNGNMARIRVWASLDSISEVVAPVILPTDTNAVKEQKNHLFRVQPKKGLMIYLQSPSQEKFEVGIVDIYNVKPNFLTGVSEFFSDLQLYGIQFGWEIVAEVIDRGWGVLQVNTGENQQNDRISFTGFAIERSSFLQGNDDTVYNYIT